MGVSSWKSAFMPHDNGNSQASPVLRAAVVVTARGCPVHDAGVAYLNALKQAEAAVWPQIEGDRSIVTHVDARGSHSFPFLMDPAAATDALDSWSWGFL
jgi:acetyl esterase/lipase